MERLDELGVEGGDGQRGERTEERALGGPDAGDGSISDVTKR